LAPFALKLPIVIQEILDGGFRVNLQNGPIDSVPHRRKRTPVAVRAFGLDHASGAINRNGRPLQEVHDIGDRDLIG
jgi:hypothetical protein